MNQALFLFRPEPGWGGTARLAADAGLQVAGDPLFEIEPVEWEAPPADCFDGLLVGSANAFRVGGDGLAALRHLPVHAVGKVTANAAIEAGFMVASLGSAGLQSVVDALNPELRLLRLAGESHVALEFPETMLVATRIVYRSRPCPLAPAAALELAQGGIAALHSAEAARHFRRECERLGMDLGRITLLALGPRIAEAAGPGWQSIHIAPTPDDAALLAMARQLCHTP